MKDLTADRTVLILGLYLNSALYLLCVIAAGFITGTPFAWKAGIASLGFTYLGYAAQVMRPDWPTAGMILVGLSVAFGFLAGMSLVFR